jgi:hypothetical protein
MALTQKQERFVQGLFCGLSQRKAYKQAFDTENMADNVIDNKACELAKSNEIRVRLEEMNAPIIEETGWNKKKLIEKFAEIGEKCMKAVPVKDNNGMPTGEYKFDSAGANKAYEQIGKLEGLYIDKTEHSGTIELPQIIISK